MDVETWLVDFAHEPPSRLATRFRTSLFALDALHCAALDHRWSHLVVTDPDSVCMGPIDALVELAGDRVGAYAIDYPPEHNINGLTRREAGRIYEELDGKSYVDPIHYGGEMMVIPAAQLPAVLHRSESAWNDTLARVESGRPHFVTEEHVLSYAFQGLPVTNIASQIRRIWTASGYRRVQGDEGQLTIWHLPAEKPRGFASLYRAAVDRSSWWWHGDEACFRRKVGRIVGVPRRRPPRFARDMVYRALLGARSLVTR